MTDPLPPLTSAELAYIGAKAKAATPGEWKKDETHADVFVVYVDDVTHENAATVLFEADWATDTDAEFVAAANPETILRLIDMIERRDEKIDTLRQALQAVVSDVRDYERLNHLCPNPGHEDCWQSVAYASKALAATEPK